jgi:hypothetical protein
LSALLPAPLGLDHCCLLFGCLLFCGAWLLAVVVTADNLTSMAQHFWHDNKYGKTNAMGVHRLIQCSDVGAK